MGLAGLVALVSATACKMTARRVLRKLIALFPHNSYVLLGMGVWIVSLFFLEQSRRHGCQKSESTTLVRASTPATGTYNAGAEFHLNVETLTPPKRPLLVRFDWYSRKKSPIHIGCVYIAA